MKNLIFLLALGSLLLYGTGCNLEDDTILPNPIELPDLAADFIAENYPDFEIRSAETEDICDDVPVLEVELEDGPGPDIDLYFTPEGEFLFTATDINLADLPMAVQAAIANDFPDYSINADDVERWDYPDGQVEYEVELVNTTTGDEDDAVFAADGTLLCFEGDDNSGGGNGGDDNGSGEPVDLPESVRNFISMNYPGFEIRSAETEDICDDVLVYEVELEDGPGPDVDLYFSTDWEFLFTATDIGLADLPTAVQDAIAANFPDYSINAADMERWDYPDGSVEYEVELVHNTTGEDDDAVFAADGTLICFEDDSDDDPNGGGAGGNLPTAVSDFIATNYGGYIVTSVEQEDICDDQQMYEVELEDGPGPDVELYFDLNWELQFTLTEIGVSELPEMVRNAIASSYAEYTIDEDKVERLDFVSGELRYAVELESDDDDLEIIFNADGSLYCLDD